MFDLKGKIAVITGSSKGIGAGIAEILSKAGAKVVIASRNEKECESEAKKIKGETFCVKSDVSIEEDVKNMLDKTYKKYGSVDIMVNNAGIFEQKAVDEMDTAMWKRVQAVDLDGVFYGTKYAAQYMKGKKWGRIINISSVAGVRGFGQSTAYCTAKAGVLGFTKAAAIDLAHYGITVNAICPGLIDTPMTVEFTKDSNTLNAMLQPILIKRAGQPQDIANAALYLASEESAYVTGTQIIVDGGWICHL